MHSAIVVVNMPEKSEAEGHHPKWLAFEADLLTPALRRQDHTTSPSAAKRSRQQRRLRPPHPLPYVRDDRETPLRVGRDGERYRSDLGQTGTEIFLLRGLRPGKSA